MGSLYRKLQKYEIRILTILPGGEDETLQCQLQHTSLRNPARYDSLSYEWGSPGAPGVEIIVDEHKLVVTTNCSLALKELRREAVANNTSRVIWIDAICINQQDLDERREQVLLMRAVYHHAHNLVVWLGLEANGSDKAIEIMTVLDEYKTAEEDVTGWYAEYFGGPRRHENWLAIAHLYGRTWFQRAWVVQEYTAFKDKNAPVFYCGRNRLTDSAMKWAIPIGDLWASLSPIAGPGEPPRADPETEERAAEIGAAFQTGLSSAMGMVMDYMDRPRTNAGAALYLFSKLIINTERKATEPRDMIYAHLGSVLPLPLISDPDEAEHAGETSGARGDATPGVSAAVGPDERSVPFVPDISALIVDYNTPSTDVSASLIRYMVLQTKSLNVLSLCEPHATYSSRRWALDPVKFSWLKSMSLLTRKFMFAERHKTFRASSDLGASAVFADDLSVLSIQGVQWSKIQHVFSQKLGSGLDDQDELDGHIHPRKARSFLNYGLEHELNGNFDHVQGAFWSASIGKIVSASDGAGGIDTGRSDDLLRFNEDHNKDRQGQSIFVTESGDFGSGGSWVQPGDCVCVILGCDVPLVLRQAGDSWELVGDCYLPGIMNGEAVEGTKDGSLAPVTFQCV